MLNLTFVNGGGGETSLFFFTFATETAHSRSLHGNKPSRGHPSRHPAVSNVNRALASGQRFAYNIDTACWQAPCCSNPFNFVSGLNFIIQTT